MINAETLSREDAESLFKISLKEYKVYFQQSIGDNLDSFLFLKDGL